MSKIDKCVQSMWWLVVLSLLLLAPTPARAADGNPLEAILGPDAAGWKISAALKPEVENGQPVLKTGTQAVNFLGPTAYAADMEYTLVFRLDSRVRQGGARLAIGAVDYTARREGNDTPSAALYNAPNTDDCNWYIYGAKSRQSHGAYNLRGISRRSLTWPEEIRKTIERDMALLPGPAEKPFTLRCVVRPGEAQFFLDDRLLDIRRETIVAGKPFVQLAANTRLISFRARSLPPANLYYPVPLEGYVNASAINGAEVDTAKLPAAEKAIRGVPFRFPAANERGMNHISLAPSWAPFGSTEGYEESNTGEFGGRWPNALRVNPARIQLRLPKAPYTKLHLIAAADSSPDSVPVVSAVFFRGSAGMPQTFAARVPLATARATSVLPLPVKGGNGGSLFLVTIALNPNALSSLMGEDIVDIELTKEVQQFRSYPDPAVYSFHQGGLPSGVHIFAATLERAPVDIDFAPDQFGHVWTAPAKPSYTVTLRNRTAAARTVELQLTTLSHNGAAKTSHSRTVTVPPGEAALPVKLTIPDLRRYGYHAVELAIKDGATAWTERRSLAWLHPETRDKVNWQDGEGPLLGFWAWGGGHDTPTRMQEMQVMAAAGAQTMLGTLGSPYTALDVKVFAQQNHMFTSMVYDNSAVYNLGFTYPPIRDKWNPADPAGTTAALLEALNKAKVETSAVSRPQEVAFFPEPSIGPITHGTMPDFYGEPEYQFSDSEEKAFQFQLSKFLLGARLVRRENPNAKLLLPHGDPLYTVPFLRRSAEARTLIDGVALDMPGFERMPEQQIHQVCHHRLYMLNEEFRKVGTKPYYSVQEGTCVPTPIGALTWDEQADIYTRNFLIYFAYGVYRHPSGPTPFDCANYWGEEHYGACGLFTRLPHAAPKPSYAAYATLSRHLNRANYQKWLPVGSHSTYCLQFKNVKTGRYIYVPWTIRGKRTISLSAPAGATVTQYDEDDNATVLPVRGGRVTCTIDASPCYIEGLGADVTATLGAPDHSDARPATGAVKLGNPGDGSWRQVTQPDPTYADNSPVQVARFPGNMSLAPVSAPAASGGRALAVHLGAQEKERKIMPFYTALAPAKPIVIPGKASHIGLWVKAASDWGRVVYALRDAKGERWISVGTREQWNCDDTHQWSSFNFDGWRYLTFEMPSNLGYDNFREKGSTWWGHSAPGEGNPNGGAGDGVVDLPVALEKIIVERRTHAMYVNDPQTARPDDVWLGDLYAEYAQPFDKTAEVVRQSRLRMPLPVGTPDIGNPITELATQAVGDAPVILRVDPPAHQYDGTRAEVFFTPVPAAASYDVWVSPYADGTGALKLGAGWKGPGQLITGLRPEVDFYVFLTYTDAQGKVSKPSAPFKIRLKDLFGMK